MSRVNVNEESALMALNLYKKNPTFITLSNEVIEIVIQALEKQVFKKVMRHGGNYDCPICGKPAMTISIRKKDFCDFCGQKLDWD